MKELHEVLRQWIANVLQSHRCVMSIALRQRAKFEGWLKFELAAQAEMNGATNVVVEAPLPERGRSDLSFDWEGVQYDVELKTPNTNWRMPGILELTRPITKNFSSIVADARKATEGHRNPIVAFVIFPVPCGDVRWHQYYERVCVELGVVLARDLHTTQITVPISQHHDADVVVCCIPVPAQVRH